jgi:hypothetical protein
MNHSNYTKEEIVSRGEVLYINQFRRPKGVFCALRIGYTAVETIGGVLQRNTKVAWCSSTLVETR